MSDQVVSSTPAREQFIRENYNERGRLYDLQAFGSAEGNLYVELEERVFLELTGARAPMKVLDVGTGTGRIAVGLAKAGATVTGVDISEGMLAQARQKAEAAGVAGRARFELASARELPFGEGTFDAITASRFLHLWPNDEKVHLLREMRRVLKPDGFVVVHLYSFLDGIERECLRALRGKGLNLWRASFHYCFPRQIPRLFREMRIEQVVGVKLPGLGKLARLVGRERALALNRVLRCPPLYFFNKHIIVKASKKTRGKM